MFGYVRADTPYLYIKDDNLYKAAYCGVCKAIGKVCGMTARMGLSYDVTFFSVLLHNISGKDLTVENSHCAAHCIGKKRPMAKTDEITRALGAMNTVLAYLKYDDDVKDEKKDIYDYFDLIDQAKTKKEREGYIDEALLLEPNNLQLLLMKNEKNRKKQAEYPARMR